MYSCLNWVISKLFSAVINIIYNYVLIKLVLIDPGIFLCVVLIQSNNKTIKKKMINNCQSICHIRNVISNWVHYIVGYSIVCSVLCCMMQIFAILVFYKYRQFTNYAQFTNYILYKYKNYMPIRTQPTTEQDAQINTVNENNPVWTKLLKLR